jgi:hypothetical protein
MAKTKPTVLAAELPQKAQTRIVRWMTQIVGGNPKPEGGMPPGVDGRIVTFHGRAGEAALKAIVAGKDVALYRYKRGLDLQMRTALAQDHLSQKCGVLTSDPSVIAALDAAKLPADENTGTQSRYAVAIGRLTEAEAGRRRPPRAPDDIETS